jgi:transposase
MVPPEEKDASAHSAPSKVRDPVFLAHPEFFDPRDPVQVKYEMLRSHYVEDAPVAAAARRFGFSRQSFYTAAARFAAQRLLGLLPGRPGPKAPHKVTPEMEAFFHARFRDDPNVRPDDLAEEARKRFGVEVHPRTVRRSLGRKKKQQGSGPRSRGRDSDVLGTE